MPVACCFICGSSFAFAYNLNVHLKQVHNTENVPEMKCELCDYVGKQQNLRQHVKNYHGEKISCDMCENSFVDKSTLNRHIKNKHKFSEGFQCPVCPKSFSRREHLKLHKMVHEPVDIKAKQPTNFTCEFCMKAFNDQSNLKRHKKNTHFIVNDTRKMNNNDNLKEDMHKKTANDQKPSEKDFVCEPCQKNFSSKKTLMQHLKSWFEGRI